MGFRKHQESKTHQEAVEVVITLPQTASNVGELLSKAHKQEREFARNMLGLILSRQGLALRGSDDAESNLIQLLRLRAEDNPQLLRWLDRSSKKYRIAGKFGGDLNLAVWRSFSEPPNLIPPKCLLCTGAYGT